MILEQTKPTEVAPKPAKKVDEPKAEKPAARAEASASPALGADGEPLADWEIELAEHEGTPVAPDARRVSEQNPNNNRNNNDRGDRNNNRHNNNRNNNDRGDRNNNDRGDRNNDRGERDNNRADGGGFGNNRNRNRRRRGKGPRDEGPQGNDRYETVEPESTEPISTEPVKVSGYVDLRDEGYGFLRVNGYLPSREDSYISVRLTRQYGLRKGDHVSGMSKPAGRNEKNPAMLDVETINHVAADKVKNRPRFEDLTPLFPDSKLGLENAADPNNMTARIIDLIAPIG
jgi:transcription termination factor Rho